MQENLIRRTCDYCGEKVLLKQNEEPAERWLITVREEFKDGNPAPTVKHYCKDSCAVNALRLSEPSEVPAWPPDLRDSESGVRGFASRTAAGVNLAGDGARP